MQSMAVIDYLICRFIQLSENFKKKVLYLKPVIKEDSERGCLLG